LAVAENGGTDLRFEFFKHMSTVGTAAATAVVAVYGLSKKVLRDTAENLGWPDWVILAIPGFAIGGFFLSLLLALMGLYFVAKAQSDEENSVAISRILRLSAATFILGVGISAATAGLIVAGPKIASILVVFFVLLAFMILVFLGIKRSSDTLEGAQDLAAGAEDEEGK